MGHQRSFSLASNISRSDIHILAVDDSPDIREYFLRVMSALDLRCDVAVGGAEALSMIEARRGKPYNVFFVDWHIQFFCLWRYFARCRCRRLRRRRR